MRLSGGKVKVRIKHAIQSAETATDTAAPRIRFGNISAISTQTTGAKDMA